MALAARIGRAGLVAGVLAVSGCATAPAHHAQVAPPAEIAPSSPTEGGAYKIGAPYQVDGVWYYPAENFSYREEGIASWYGQDFNGKHTANGERFDMNAVSAAHPTLPMPSSVKVTNLDNGRQLDVRVNDRGPYKSQRIIDLSRRAAQLLGFDLAGTAHVRVEINAEESLRLKNEALRTNPGEMPQVAAAPREAVTAVALSPLPPATPAPAASSAHAPPPQAPPKTVVAIADPPTLSDGPPLAHAVVDDPPVQHHAARPDAHTKRPEKVIKVASTAKDPKGQTTPLALPPVAAGPGIYVQAGAFSDISNAQHLEQQLKEFGNSFVLPITLNNRQLYRVRLGPLADDAMADTLLGRVRAYGYDDAQIVRY